MCIIFDGCIHPHQHPGQRRRLGLLGYPALTPLPLKSSVATILTRRRSLFWLPWQLGRIRASYICKILIFLLKDLPSAHQHQVCRYGMRQCRSDIPDIALTVSIGKDNLYRDLEC